MSAELVTIVTAFVDIGRGDWEGSKNDKPIPPGKNLFIFAAILNTAEFGAPFTLSH